MWTRVINAQQSSLDQSDNAFKPEDADVSDDIRHEIMVNGKVTVHIL